MKVTYNDKETGKKINLFTDIDPERLNNNKCTLYFYSTYNINSYINDNSSSFINLYRINSLLRQKKTLKCFF